MNNTRDPQNGSMGKGDPAVSTEQKDTGDTPVVSDHLNKDQPSTEGEGAPIRKSSLLGD